MGKMMDFHVHRRILGILSEMQEDLSGGRKRKEHREPAEYLAFFDQLGDACREYGFSQAHYGKILEKLRGIISLCGSPPSPLSSLIVPR